MKEYFPEPKYSRGTVKVDFNLKSDVDKLDINKFKIVPTNLKNLKTKKEKLGVHK